MLDWNTAEGQTSIIDVPTQPIDTVEIDRVLLDLATGARAGDTEIAGPSEGSLVGEVRELVRRRDLDVEVVAVAGPPTMAGGSMLPGPGAEVRGITWQEWLDRQ
jgi:hypothetical protein